MKDGGVFNNHTTGTIQMPAWSYERACQVAHYLKNNKPKSKIVIYDANEKIQSKGAYLRDIGVIFILE